MKINTKKIINIITILVVLITFIGIYPNYTKASFDIDKAELYLKGEIENQFSYQGVPVFVEYTVYNKDGREYPAYCLNRNLPGITSEREYTVQVTKELENVAVWRAIMNGYPYQSVSQLKCETAAEAYAATKMAVYDALYTYDWDDFEKITDSGERIIQAAKKISEKARSSKQVQQTFRVDIKTISDDWEVDINNPNYVSKTYALQTTNVCQKYKIEVSGEDAKDVLILDDSGQKRDSFIKIENFKIAIPISKLDKDGSFKIKMTADLESYPILYGESPSEEWQDYALTGKSIIYIPTSKTEKFYKNDTKIKIVKKDAQTGETKQGAKFNVLNEKKEVVYANVTTDETGTAILENIIPGRYYIEEVQAPEDYTEYDGLIEIEVGLNETYTVNVENQKEEEKDVPPEKGEKEITVTGKTLPRTGY